jgi:hypothetical protein
MSTQKCGARRQARLIALLVQVFIAARRTARLPGASTSPVFPAKRQKKRYHPDRDQYDDKVHNENYAL